MPGRRLVAGGWWRTRTGQVRYGAGVTERVGARPRLWSVLHYFMSGLLVAMAMLIAWFSGYAVYKLYGGQR